MYDRQVYVEIIGGKPVLHYAGYGCNNINTESGDPDLIEVRVALNTVVSGARTPVDREVAFCQFGQSGVPVTYVSENPTFGTDVAWNIRWFCAGYGGVFYSVSNADLMFDYKAAIATGAASIELVVSPPANPTNFRYGSPTLGWTYCRIPWLTMQTVPNFCTYTNFDTTVVSAKINGVWHANTGT